MILFGILGLLLITYAVWMKNEKQQDVLFILGGFALLVYSLWIRDAIFIFLQIVFILSSAFELYKVSRKR